MQQEQSMNKQDAKTQLNNISLLLRMDLAVRSKSYYVWRLGLDQERNGNHVDVGGVSLKRGYARIVYRRKNSLDYATTCMYL